jgi:hypothetical protein
MTRHPYQVKAYQDGLDALAAQFPLMSWIERCAVIGSGAGGTGAGAAATAATAAGAAVGAMPSR